MSSPSCAKQTPLNLKEPMMDNNNNNVQYPMPLARYEDVVANPKLFMDTLRKFHASMSGKPLKTDNPDHSAFRTPIVGGKELDLHRLFVEVTSRGGIDKIVKERRWKEVTATFNFPSTATNASFVLRKYYVMLLQHYEQLYFFKARNWTPGSSGSLETEQAPAQVTMQPSQNYQAATSQKLRTNTVESPGVAAKPGLSGSSPVIGVIDGKFESGYLVSVTIGSEKLKGVLYEVPNGQSFLTQQHNVHANIGSAPTVPGKERRRRRKKSEIKRRDPDHPKPNRSGYNFFFAEQHARLKPLYPGKDREISKMIGELWNKIDESQKAVYQEKALKDKERYRVEMEEYREKLRTGRAVSNPAPLQQWQPQQDTEMVDADIRMGQTEEGDSPMSTNNQSSSGESDYEDDMKGNKEDIDMDATTHVVGPSTYSGNVATDGSAGFNERTCMDVNVEEKKIEKDGELREENLLDTTIG